MATMSPHTSAKIVSGRPEILFTAHAEQMIKARRVGLPIVMKAVWAGKSRIDSKSGHEVFRAGDLRIVAKRDGNRITILTAMHAGDLDEYAG